MSYMTVLVSLGTVGLGRLDFAYYGAPDLRPQLLVETLTVVLMFVILKLPS